VLQAQKEIEKLTAGAGEVQPPAEASTSASTSTTERGEGTSRSVPSTSSASEKSGTEGTEGSESLTPVERSTAGDETPSASTSSQSLFGRLQSAIPPNLILTVQNNIPESLKSASENIKSASENLIHASESIDISQIGNNLLTEFQRVQGITRVQAEEYARKSEALIREAVREANEVLKDAVKIIPPEEGEGGVGAGLVWDGSDMWMLPVDQSQASGSGKEREGSAPPENQTAVASRALALLQRLQSDPTIIQHDPEVDEGAKEAYKAWLADEFEAKGGAEGKEWKERSEKLLKDEAPLAALYASLGKRVFRSSAG